MPRTQKTHRSPRPAVLPLPGLPLPGARGRPAASVPDAPPTRTIVLWSPDWPITAVTRSTSAARNAPLALIEKNLVFACSAEARAHGVSRGLRLREAQARCPELLVQPYDPSIDARAFEPVLAAIEALTPGVQMLRPGMVAIRSRGPARYYGSEKAAAMALTGMLDDLGIPGTRVGIADGPFAAEHASRSPASQHSPVLIPVGASAAFLAPLPVAVLGDPELVGLLRRLGILTLGDFAGLPAANVRDRFGATAVWLHSLAAGADGRSVAARTAPPEFDVHVDFEPPLDRIDQVTFGVRTSADEFLARLIDARLVCTALRVEVETEGGEFSERTWLHPRSFTPSDVVDRVRWQLQGSGEVDVGLRSGISRVRLVPEAVDPVGDHETGLWGTGPDERVHHALTRVQSMLGHGGVLQAVVGGGRTLADRTNLVPWGEPTSEAVGPRLRPAERPWPGRLPSPEPATVFPTPHPVHVFALDDTMVRVDERGALSAAPARFSFGARVREITAWAGPWTIDERWWDAANARRAHRFQVVDEAGSAWLLVCEQREEPAWFLEAKYD